jgi:hypothetical protein
MAKKKYNPTVEHLNHPAEMREGRGPHPAQLWCMRCNRHIKWMTPAEISILNKPKSIAKTRAICYT